MPPTVGSNLPAPCQRLRARRAEHGMTLLEASLVLALVALMAGTAVYFMRSEPCCPPYTRAEADIEYLRTVLLLYRTETGSLPSTSQGLKTLVSHPVGDPQAAHGK